MDMSRNSSRRLLIGLILILIVIQISVLVYLRNSARPATSQDTAAGPTAAQFHLPTRPPNSTTEPTTTRTPARREIDIGPPGAATDYTQRARMFDEEQALEHLVHLASSEMGGRQPGTSGGRAAGEYIARRFAEYGLQPAGIHATYFQTFTVPYGRITELPVLTVAPPVGERLTHTYAYRTDYRALTGGYTGAGGGEGPVIWLNQCLHEDYAGIDMVGKIAMCRYAYDPRIFRQAIEHRVGGLLLLDREGGVSTNRRPAYGETAWVPQTIPAYLISETVALDLLVGTNHTLDDLSLRFSATPLSTTVTMAVATEEKEDVEARNVLGYLPGSDPERCAGIVAIGAHYDHLGRDPDGEIMYGANDNASGVATMLEIARLWQAQNYRPACSVLFAAWDGEEMGLLGSRYYVQDPTLPLTRTVAYLNLDMVGAGGDLNIDGRGGAVVTQLEASAEIYGVTTTLSFSGRSDHVSFYEAGVSAANLIWWPDAVYHTPDDTSDSIEPGKLKTVGVLSAHALAALAQGRSEVEQAVERLRTSILAHDKETFLASIDPNDPDLQTSQVAWFDNLWSHDLVQAVMDVDRIRIGKDGAKVTLSTAYGWADVARPTRPTSYDVRFVQRNGTWHFAGYELDELSGDVVTVARFPDVPVTIGELLTSTQQAYVSLATELGLEPVTGTRFIYYPDAATMRTIARPAADQATLWSVSSAGLGEIAWGHPITPALIHLALNQMGLPPDAGSWLREGLMLHYEPDTRAEYLPTVAGTDTIGSLLDFPDLADLEATEARVLRGYAWNATEYLLARHGIDGLHAICAAWGRSGDQEVAFREGLGLSLDQFESAWRAEQIAPLRADAKAIQAVIAARIEAVLTGNEQDFLTTLNPANPILRVEEHNWFTHMVDHPLETYTATGTLIEWSPHEPKAVVALSVKAKVPGKRVNSVTYRARFLRQDDRWLYDGVAWNELTSGHFVLKYNPDNHNDAWARHVLEFAEEAYTQISADLGTRPPLPQEIKVYDDNALFRALVSPTLPDGADGWTRPGEAIKCQPRDTYGTTERSLQIIIARELTHQALATQGLETDWLRTGIAAFEAGRIAPLGTHWVAGKYIPIVQEAVRRHDEFPLHDLPSWEDVPADQGQLFHAQSWSLVSFAIERYGLEQLRQFVARSISSDTSNDADAMLRAVLKVDTETLLEDWREQVYAAAVPDTLLSLAQHFDPERAMADVAILSSPHYGGREAGTAGAELAATYIAEQYAALGLQPMGDLVELRPADITESLAVANALTAAVTDTATITDATDYATRGYLQRFPISHTHIISIPTLTLLDSEGRRLYEFVYGEDFVERVGEGVADGELVWVRPGALEGLHFGGAVILHRDVRLDPVYIAQLKEHGAGGLIVANMRESDGLRTNQDQFIPTPETAVTLPVFEITETAFETLVRQLGMEQEDLTQSSSPALPLNLRMRQTVAYTPVTTTQTSNVLGLLPGSDPDLADEVLVVGAHYDHIGLSPDGVPFPGANQNASGVGALLEMARVWQSMGYHPARTVLFAAWGAEEVNGAGAAHYLTDPVIPVTQTVGVIALDSIAGGRGQKLMFHGTREHDLPLIHRTEASAGALDRRAWREGNTGEGWHELFNQADIPTVKLIWDGAEEQFYQPADTAEAIDADYLATSGEILTLTASWLASR
jgi:Zn-dependent M28 family amino/carboxypeptidase